MTLRVDNGFGRDADSFYEALIAAHHGLSDQESAALNARLILILANQVGDMAVLAEALRAARAAGRGVGDERREGRAPAQAPS